MLRKKNHSQNSKGLKVIYSGHLQKMLPGYSFWRVAEDIPQNLAWTLMFLSIAVPLVLWWAITSTGLISPLFLPSLGQVLGAFQRLLVSGDLQTDTAFSLFRVSVGFLLVTVVSVPLGLLMGAFASIRALLEPIIGIVRYMPAPAFIPLLILYFGVEETSKIMLIFIGNVFFNILMVMDAVKFVPKELLDTTYTLGANKRQILLQVIFPFILPTVINACRVNMAGAWNLVIVSELVAATEGLGRRISVAQRFLKTDEIFASLIVIGLIGLVFDLLFQFLLRISCKWAVD
ncbi:ABC transporter permease [Fischerella thermalis CCMEE 5198]|jgi:NitT/TauT family transport system permease protein|uniref:ABC transporter permease n=1 Tax=Fischerella thermalis TaxID=372787 RepID=UPI000C7FC443|nr:ABC transporter permease [Fischerella thermalis]PMB05748.1 ABC transporter permease [Fischerella thermalis CCMEE 5196]PMB23354.1 ABC transporter permease [Fischerella thermalis CCMEE 5198]PMB53224.1 ABC transporter permease [Fischerella thermalis CCMEE 5201]